ncbi:unnamed protein product, partial [Phaeothamnion confervicola]
SRAVPALLVHQRRISLNFSLVGGMELEERLKELDASVARHREARLDALRKIDEHRRHEVDFGVGGLLVEQQQWEFERTVRLEVLAAQRIELAKLRRQTQALEEQENRRLVELEALADEDARRRRNRDRRQQRLWKLAKHLHPSGEEGAGKGGGGGDGSSDDSGAEGPEVSGNDADDEETVGEEPTALDRELMQTLAAEATARRRQSLEEGSARRAGMIQKIDAEKQELAAQKELVRDKALQAEYGPGGSLEDHGSDWDALKMVLGRDVDFDSSFSTAAATAAATSVAHFTARNAATAESAVAAAAAAVAAAPAVVATAVPAAAPTAGSAATTPPSSTAA